MAGTVAVTMTALPGTGVVRYAVAWVATAGGAVSGNPLNIKAGHIVQVELVPGTGSPGEPTTLYDVTLVDQYGVDVLLGAGADLAAGKLARLDPPVFYDGVGSLDLVVANAGNAGAGTVVLWVRA